MDWKRDLCPISLHYEKLLKMRSILPLLKLWSIHWFLMCQWLYLAQPSIYKYNICSELDWGRCPSICSELDWNCCPSLRSELDCPSISSELDWNSCPSLCSELNWSKYDMTLSLSKVWSEHLLIFKRFFYIVTFKCAGSPIHQV